MPLSVKDGGTWRSVKNVYVNDAGTWRLLEKSYANDAGTWRLGHQKFSVSVDDNYVLGYNLSGMVFTAAATASGVGGWPGYTYYWEEISGRNAPVAPGITSASSASTTFTLNPQQVGVFTANFRCTVTDTLGQSGTVNVTAEFEHGT